MARIIAPPTPAPVTIDRFLGLNEDSAGDTQLLLGESPNMTNFRLTENLKLVKREGYKSLITALGTSIRGLWYGKVGGNYKFLYASGGTIYSFNTFTNVSTSVGTLTDATTTFFEFKDKVYVMNGYEYKSWNGTGSFADVAGYVPLIATATPPTGGGSDNEGINLLTGKKRQKFSGNGTAATYTLRETSLTSVDAVYVGGILKTVTTHYTVNLSAGTIAFTSGNIPATGVDNVEIYWTKGSGSRSEITGYKCAMLFGGQNDTRVFTYGNGTNKYHYSGLADGVPSAEYFPALNFQEVGNTGSSVTGIVRQYDRQIIYTDRSAYYSYYDTITDTSGNVIPSFPTFPLNSVVGNLALGQVQIVQNNPFTLKDGVYEWVATNVRDERNATFKSKRVQTSLSQELLNNALTVDFEHKKEYWVAIGQNVWIYNYLVDAWYRFKLTHTPTCFLEVDGTLYFGTTGGQLMMFDDAELVDAGTTFAGHWESGFYNFGLPYLQKFLSKMWVSLKPGTPQDVNFTWKTEDSESSEATNISIKGLFNYASINYANWLYGTNYDPTPFRIKIKAKKFVYFKLLIDSSVNNGSAAVLSISLSTRTGGESK